ncbi:MAG: aminotransferase class I/II-fold pyridoxal phosphate-dependent enzyme [Candidatus Omnitrophica bacterium]|nr:aminotransferase class I/II-fold pyridoxal phosphate-dependent enzyme [Candidatus Omnitrophota bacterium]
MKKTGNKVDTSNLISRKVKKLAPSGIRAFFDLVLGMEDVVSLGVGEPDFVTPWNIRETGIFSIEQGFTSYTSNKGLYKLRLIIHRMLKQSFGLEYCAQDEMLITVGVSEALDLAMRAIINPGDEIIVPEPCYVSYGPVVELAGGNPVFLPTKQKDGFKITPSMLDGACNKKTKAILLNYPSNPTGSTYSKVELEKINKVCKKHKLIVISDEVYGDLTYDCEHVPYPTLKGAKDYTLYLNGLSKAYAMTGWRIGYACGPKPIIAAMTKIHQYTILCATITSQMAACEALHSGGRSLKEMKREYKRRREFMYKNLNEMGLICSKPRGAFYIFAQIEASGMNCLEFASKLLEEEKVAVVPGVAFGLSYDNYVRMSYSTGYPQLKEAVIRMKKFMGRHQKNIKRK